MAKDPREQQAQRDGGSPLEVSPRQARQIEQRIFPSAVIVHEAIRLEGEEEIERAPMALVWSGLAAGLSMGFSLLGKGLLWANLPPSDWRVLIAGMGYTTGFLFVVLGRQQLFTENTLTPILPLLSRRTWEAFWKVMRLWGLVLAANLAGALIFATAVAHTDVFPPDYHDAFREIANKQASGMWLTILLRGIFAGWLIALMVWLLPGAQAAHVWVIFVTTYLIAIAGLTHIIAGSVDVLYLVVTGEMAWWRYLWHYMLPTLIGNVVGGVALVAALNHAQVIAGKDEKDR